jgi:hypothetical protein
MTSVYEYIHKRPQKKFERFMVSLFILFNMVVFSACSYYLGALNFVYGIGPVNDFTKPSRYVATYTLSYIFTVGWFIIYSINLWVRLVILIFICIGFPVFYAFIFQRNLFS